VHVVTAERDPDAVAGRVACLDLGNTIAIEIAQAPEMRDVGVEDVAVEREHPRTGSIKRIIERTREHRSRLRQTVAIGVCEPRHAIVVLRVVRHPAGSLRGPPLVHAQPVGDRLALEVIKQPERA